MLEIEGGDLGGSSGVRGNMGNGRDNRRGDRCMLYVCVIMVMAGRRAGAWVGRGSGQQLPEYHCCQTRN